MAYIGVQPTDTYLSIASQQITGTGSATYTLDYSVSNEEDVAVFVNNVRQNVNTYTVSGTSLTLGGTISASDSCWVLFLGRTVGTKTPAVGSVTNAMLQNSSITLNGSAVSLGGSATVGGNNTPAFFAYKASGSNQTISNNTYTQVEFNTESFDTDSNYASNRFTPTTAGKYFIFANIAADASAGQFDSALLAIRKNGSLLYEVTNQQSTNNANHINMAIQIIDDANGSSDYYEVWIYITDSSGSPVINAGGSNRRCTFGAYKLIGV